MENYMREASVQNVLQRTRIIEDEKESADIVNQIRNIGLPIGVDMEGHHGLATGWGALKPGSRLRPKTLQVIFSQKILVKLEMYL